MFYEFGCDWTDYTMELCTEEITNNVTTSEV